MDYVGVRVDRLCDSSRFVLRGLTFPMNGLPVATSGIFAGDPPHVMSSWRPGKGRFFHIIKPNEAADVRIEYCFPRPTHQCAAVGRAIPTHPVYPVERTGHSFPPSLLRRLP